MCESIDHFVDRRFAILLREGFPLPKQEAIQKYLDRLDDLIWKDPGEAAFFAHMVPLLAPYITESEARVRALGIASTAFAAGGQYVQASMLLDEAEAIASSDEQKAEICARRLTVLIALENWEGAREALGKGRAFAARAFSPKVSAWLDIQSGRIAMEADQDYSRAARESLRALATPDCTSKTRQAAFTNLANALKSLDPRLAHRLLRNAYSWRSIKNATFHDYVLAWIDGYVRAYVAETQEERRAARQRLCWVAEGLHAMGRETDAILATLDLVALTYERRVQGQAARVAATVIKTLIEHPDTPDELRRRARRYLDNPTHPTAVQLRRICLELYGGSLFKRLSHRESLAA